MLNDSKAFASFSTNDIDKAEAFYSDTLGLDVKRWGDEGMGEMLWIPLPGGGRLFIYHKEDHQPATHTVLNFEVADFDAEVAALRDKGVTFEVLEWTDEDGIARDIEGRMPATAWFKDPAGNWILIGETMTEEA
ncbi:VOC family protein [Demequina maris]|uniref:VOC family protein n=1 Tax=Demequina maris TaxID=1638982 RepID=UPI0007806182|nr:VOC family protein [Demequina maris]